MADRLDGKNGGGFDEALAKAGLNRAKLERLRKRHAAGRVPRLERLWRYFRNPIEPAASDAVVLPVSGAAQAGRAYRVAQEAGLPGRLTGAAERSALDDRLMPRPEIVVENDIGWRVQTMVDFMFGDPVGIVSTAGDSRIREQVERVLDAVWEASGGAGLMQDIALIGHVYGYVDLVVRIDEAALLRDSAALARSLASGSPNALADLIRVEVIEPRRGIPVMSGDDYRRLDGYVLQLGAGESDDEDGDAEVAAGGVLNGVLARLTGRRSKDSVASRGGEDGGAVTEVIGAGSRVVCRGERVLVDERSVLLRGVLPVVHIQNLSQPFRYEGLSEVEPLIPLQDELNTRLSDRASRVTMQSFRMYLAKGLEGFENAPVGPGQIWSTDNPDASITAFGADGDSPSERDHIAEIREAMDKISAVPPLAGGVVRARIGNLSSANALRITLMSILAKTDRKRVSYGRGIAEASRMMLAALDAAGILQTGPWDRGIRLRWPSALPLEPAEAVRVAAAKIEAGVDRGEVLEEIGYATTDDGVK